jgi:hypothetical protein
MPYQLMLTSERRRPPEILTLAAEIATCIAQGLNGPNNIRTPRNDEWVSSTLDRTGQKTDAVTAVSQGAMAHR